MMMSKRSVSKLLCAVVTGLGLATAALPGQAAPIADPVKTQPAATEASDKVVWFRATSDHFIVYSELSQEKTVTRLKALEQFHDFLSKLLPPPESDGSEESRLTIYFLANTGSLRIVDPRDLAGIYISCAEGVSAFSAQQLDLTSKRLRLDQTLPSQDIGQTVLFHEYAHHVMFRNAPASYPLWYIEGFAEYFSTFDFDGQTATIGLAPHDDNWVLSQVNWGAFEKVLAPDDKLSSGLAVDPRANPNIFYAKAWLLTHYMLSDPARAKALNVYFASLRDGQEPVSAFRKATGIDPGEDLRHRLREYSKAMPYHQISLTAAPDAHIAVTRLSDTDDAFRMLEAAMGTCASRSRGKVILKILEAESDPAALDALPEAQKRTQQDTIKALKLESGDLAKNEDYKLAVAYGEILYGDPAAQTAFLNAIPASDPHYDRAQYLLGRAWLTISDSAPETARAADRTNAVSALGRAYSLHPDDASTQYFLARAYEGRSDFPNDNAMNAAIGANQAAPSVYEYASYAAWLTLLKGNSDDAVFLLTPFATDPHRLERAKRVTPIIDAIKAKKPTAEVKAMMDAVLKPAETPAAPHN